MNKLTRKGFTLIELLVVIAVLGILAAVVLVAINPQARLQDARNSGLQSDIGQQGTALEAYFTENNGSYPSALSELVTDNQLKTQPTLPTGRAATCNPTAGSNYNFTTGGGEGAVWAELEPCGSSTYYVYWTVCGKALEGSTQPSTSNVTNTANC